MTLFIETLQEVMKTFNGCTLGCSIEYNEDRNIFTIKLDRWSSRGTPCVSYDGESFTYQILDCPEYDDPMCKSIEDLYETMFYIEED